MNFKLLLEYFVVGLPWVMAAVFVAGAFGRWVVWYTVRRHEWFARQFELRVNRFIDKEKPGQVPNVSFYMLSKKLLERTYYETFAVRDRLKRRRGDGMMGLSDRIFLIKPGCAWLVKDILNQLKFLKWTQETPKLMQITRATLSHNPCFNRVFGIIPIGGMNDLLGILPGMFVIGGILGTFIGISAGLQDLGGMDLQNLENTKNVMDRFLNEIAFAMKTSIVGIVFSILMHLTNVVLSPERVFVSMVDRLETSFDLLWYRADNNNFPMTEDDFDEYRDPADALAEDSVNVEVQRFMKKDPEAADKSA